MWRKLSTQVKITTTDLISSEGTNLLPNNYKIGTAAFPLRCRGFALVEILIGTLITVIVMASLYFLFISGSRQANSGTAKLKSFHRLRIVMETLKDDIREAVEFDQPELNKGPSSNLEFHKFISSLENVGNNQGVGPRTRKVSYSFIKEEKRLKGVYADEVEFINTQLFENVEFERYSMGDRIFVRLHFRVKRDNKNPNNLISIYQTVGARHVNTRRTQKYWFNLPETLPKREIE